MASEDSDRQRRLAEALRANLRRRKGQARERDTVAEADEPMDAGGADPRETAARPDEDQKR